MTTELEVKERITRADIKWGEVVQYIDGIAFGIAPDGATVCMGTESRIREAIADPGKRDDLSLVVLGIILLECDLQGIIERGEQDGRPTDNQLRHRTSEIRRRGHIGARPMRPARRQRPNGRQPAAE